jgi:hypothetical protein
VSSQEEIVRALCDPVIYPHRPGRVEHVQTHISHVFLAGPLVYKLKKAVRFPFLDFESAERRRHFSAEEVRLNRRLSPGVYLDVVPLTRGTGGRLGLDGDGEAVEHVVRMRRLPAERMLARLAATPWVGPGAMEALAERLAAFHATAPSSPEIAAHADPETLARAWRENLDGARAFVGHLLAAEDHEILADFGPTWIRRHETLLRARQAAGRIREGHGDLHAEHVCFVDAPLPPVEGLPPLGPGIYVFDCIEFSRPLRSNDVASEVAFLAMDLESLGRPDLAGRFVAAYAAAAADAVLPVLVPFYACHRACVRGKVEGLASREGEVEAGAREAAATRARQHFALALRYAWAAGGPALIACAGLSGSGKTTLAGDLAAATGFTRLGSDPIRKRGRGDAPGTDGPYGTGAYAPAAREAVYRTLSAEAEAALAAGQGVIADATFMARAERERLAAVARRQRCPVVFVECRAEEETVRARLQARIGAGGLSDARWETYLAQRDRWDRFGASEPHLVVDTSGSPKATRAVALGRLWRWRQGRPT